MFSPVSYGSFARRVPVFGGRLHSLRRPVFLRLVPPSSRFDPTSVSPCVCRQCARECAHARTLGMYHRAIRALDSWLPCFQDSADVYVPRTRRHDRLYIRTYVHLRSILARTMRERERAWKCLESGEQSRGKLKYRFLYSLHNFSSINDKINNVSINKFSNRSMRSGYRVNLSLAFSRRDCSLTTSSWIFFACTV